MKPSVYYLDAGITKNVGHNLETIEYLNTAIGQDVDLTVVTGKKFTGSVPNLRTLPLLRYGSPHWEEPSQWMNRLTKLRRRVNLKSLDDMVPALKAYETRRNLREVSFVKQAPAIINSMELDDAFRQCAALWAAEPSLKVKIILHYSPFLQHSVEIRPKLKKPIERILAISSGDDRLSFYADTEKLCQIYAGLLNRPVTLLPIPHSKRGAGVVRTASAAPYKVVFFGTYSEAKTPHLIPEVIRRTESGLLDWAVHITYIVRNSVVDDFERHMRALEAKTGKSMYQEGPFTTQQIEEIFAHGDIFLIPYHSHDYEIQSSGIVMEALVSGKIPVISRSMADAGVLAKIDPHLVFRPNNEVDMAANLDYIARNYNEIKEKLRPLQQEMEAFHNPRSFLKTLLGQV